MRRSRLLALLLLAVFVMDWAPGLPPIPVDAQAVSPSLFGVGNPQAIWYSTASLTVSNTQADTALLSVTIPGSLFSTAAASNFQGTNLGPANSSDPVHIVLQGALDTLASPGTINLAVNYGVGTTTNPRGLSPAVTPGSGANSGWFATMALLNAFTPGPGAAVGVPIKMDVWVVPIATGSATNATPNITNTVWVHGRVAWAMSGTTATEFAANVGTIAQVNIASAHILNVVWKFGTLGNYLRIYKVLIKQGE